MDPHGEEVRRFTKPVRSYGAIWDGVFDRQGRYWREGGYSEDREAGRAEGTGRSYYKSYDLSTETTDSVYLGEYSYRTSAAMTDRTGPYYSIPFQGYGIDILNPPGGFWKANTGTYRVAGLSEDRDTLTVIEASLPRIPVTPEDRSAYIELMVERRPEERHRAEATAALMPDFKPILEGLLVDDEDRLWVERATPNDIPPFYDLFSQDGDYLGSVRFGFTPAPYSPIWIQHGAIYTWVVDDVDVQYVVRAPLP